LVYVLLTKAHHQDKRKQATMKSTRGKTEASMDDLRMPDDDVPLLHGRGGSKQSWLARKKADFVQLFTAAYWRAKLTPETLRIIIYFFLLVLFGIGTYQRLRPLSLSLSPCSQPPDRKSSLFRAAHTTANSVTGRYNQMKFGSNYAWFNNQFSTLSYCILAQIITSYKYFFTNDITDEMKCVHTTHNTQHTTHNTQHTTHNTQHTRMLCGVAVDTSRRSLHVLTIACVPRARARLL
jgi:hypothetical protein